VTMDPMDPAMIRGMSGDDVEQMFDGSISDIDEPPVSSLGEGVLLLLFIEMTILVKGRRGDEPEERWIDDRVGIAFLCQFGLLRHPYVPL
jgi:hypothetical protein